MTCPSVPIRLIVLALMAVVQPGTSMAQGEGHPAAVCVESQLGIRIPCSPQWPVERGPRGITLRIRDTAQERVTLTIEKSRESGLLFEDLTPSALQYVYDYADHFRYSRTRLQGYLTVCIEGHPASREDLRIMDYFVLKDMTLYRMSFQVSPPARFEAYQPLFREMAGQFEFVESAATPDIPVRSDVGNGNGGFKE